MKNSNQPKTKRRSKAKKNKSKPRNTIKHKHEHIPSMNAQDSFYLRCGGVFPYKTNYICQNHHTFASTTTLHHNIQPTNSIAMRW